MVFMTLSDFFNSLTFVISKKKKTPEKHQTHFSPERFTFEVDIANEENKMTYSL